MKVVIKHFQSSISSTNYVLSCNLPELPQEDIWWMRPAYWNSIEGCSLTRALQVWTGWKPSKCSRESLDVLPPFLYRFIYVWHQYICTDLWTIPIEMLKGITPYLSSFLKFTGDFFFWSNIITKSAKMFSMSFRGLVAISQGLRFVYFRGRPVVGSSLPIQ